MKQISLLLLLLTFISCNGQNNSQSSNNNQNSIPISFRTKGDTVKELGNNLMIVYQDKKDNYWFGSWETGVYRYDGKNIIQYTTKDGLSHNRIDEIREDKSGNIFFNCNGVINKFDGKNFTTLEVSNSNNEWKLQPDDIWLKCNYDSGLVYRYDGKLLHRLTFPATKLGNEYIANHPTRHSPYSVYSIYKDTKGNIWFGTNPLGVCRYDGKSVNWISEVDVTELHDGPANGVRSIIQDKEGKFWFNTLYRYEVVDDKSYFIH